MKGRQTEEFKRILADREARDRLMEVVSKGEEGGSVTVYTGKGGGGDKVTYNIRTSKTDDLARPSGSPGGGKGGGRVK
jgi:hypothetical protein